MTSVTETGCNIEPAPVVWITGLAGAGKTTLAAEVVSLLRGRGRRPLLLDGDEVRNALEGNIEPVMHDRSHRLQRARRLAALCRLASAQGIPVVAATISLFHCVQDWNRAHLPAYYEVFLQADLELLKERRPELYGAHGAPDVVGLDIVPEFPRTPALTIVQHFRTEDLPLNAAAIVALLDGAERKHAAE